MKSTGYAMMSIIVALFVFAGLLAASVYVSVYVTGGLAYVAAIGYASLSDDSDGLVFVGWLAVLLYPCVFIAVLSLLSMVTLLIVRRGQRKGERGAGTEGINPENGTEP